MARAASQSQQDAAERSSGREVWGEAPGKSQGRNFPLVFPALWVLSTPQPPATVFMMVPKDVIIFCQGWDSAAWGGEEEETDTQPSTQGD